mmetsp:Transcript_28140/g.51556  ORF Transcript_28140/g.51556 Transcript_28140/m.51556 type:complete len:603 (-) Transcript_28140:351-2159(-)
MFVSKTAKSADAETPCSTRCPSPSPRTEGSSVRESVDSLEYMTGSFDSRTFVRHHKDSESISQRYDIDHQELASGGYGKVFKAKDKQCAGRLVAIKRCVAVDEKALQTFTKEALIMQEMDHPSICRIFELYQEGKKLDLVMEYCEGGEVFDRIKESPQGRLAEQTTRDIVRQVACALKYSHRRGIAHRDLKPENICFCNSDETDTHVKVIDWGLSTQFLLSKMKSPVGSEFYRAPEVSQADGRQTYTSSCDLWSLGVLVYVMISGKPPFWGGPTQQIRMMRSERYPMAGRDWDPVSSDAKDFIRKLLKAAPSQRMPVEDVLAHPFLQRRSESVIERSQVRKVLDSMLQAGKVSRFFSICMASAARQLDNRSLHSIRNIFSELDRNCDGVLSLSEVQEAFWQSFGKDHEVLAQVEQVFAKLDLDGTQKISYTEFCAAAMGEELCMQDAVLRAAFTSFDVQDDDGIISASEIQHVLAKGDRKASFPKVLCEKVACRVVEEFDANRDGGIDFEEFKHMMHSRAQGPREVYQILVQADTLAKVETSSSEDANLEVAREVPALRGQDRSGISTTMPGNSTTRPANQRKGRSWASRFLNMAARVKQRL